MSNRPPSSHKFFRRTSKSPANATRLLNQSQSNIFNYQPAGYNVCMKSRVSEAPETDRDSSISVSNISDESFTMGRFNRAESDFKKYRENDKYTRVANEAPKILNKNNEDLKFTYIPMQSMTTLHTLPATHKLISEAFENGRSITLTKQEYQALKKSVKELNEQNKYLLDRHKVINKQNMKLSKQIQIIRRNNQNLQTDVKKLKQNLGQAQRNLKITHINLENFKKTLEATEFMKIKYEQSYKQLGKTVLNLQSELRSVREQNSGMTRLLLMKDLEVKQVQNQLDKQIKRYKSFLELSSVVQASSPKILRPKSITFQQNKPPQQRQLTSKIKQNPAKPYIEKYSRSVQTDSNNLQKSLKQIEQMTTCLAHKQLSIKNMELEVEKLGNKTKQFEQVVTKLNESQILIQFLNGKVIYDSVIKLAAKYKYC